MFVINGIPIILQYETIGGLSVFSTEPNLLWELNVRIMCKEKELTYSFCSVFILFRSFRFFFSFCCSDPVQCVSHTKCTKSGHCYILKSNRLHDKIVSLSLCIQWFVFFLFCIHLSFILTLILFFSSQNVCHRLVLFVLIPFKED